MTIVASVKVHDGIVLGADSMTQMYTTTPTGPGLVKAYDHAQKLFQIATLPVGVMVYGSGNIGPRSVASYITEFSRSQAATAQVQVQALADALFQLLQKAHVAAYGALPADQQPGLGVFVGGFSTGSPWAEEWEFVIPGTPGVQPVRPPTTVGSAWRGAARAFTRLIFGIDPRYGPDLAQAGLQPPQVQALMQKYPTPVMFDGMPVQEAIDYVGFILETTINYAKFEVGAAICGGPLWVALITPGEGFKWIRKHELRLG